PLARTILCGRSRQPPAARVLGAGLRRDRPVSTAAVDQRQPHGVEGERRLRARPAEGRRDPGEVPLGYERGAGERSVGRGRAVAPSVVHYDYDPRRAAQLIEETGYAKGPDGMYRDASGRPLVVEVRTTAHPLREQLQPVLADYWRQVGVGLDPVVIPRQRAADREYRATTLGFDFRFNPPDFTRYHSAQVPLPENNYRGNNSARYRSPELDSLIERYLVTIPK